MNYYYSILLLFYVDKQILIKYQNIYRSIKCDDNNSVLCEIAYFTGLLLD